MDTAFFLPTGAQPKLMMIPARDVDAGGAWLFWKGAASVALRRSLLSHGQLQPVLIDASSRPLLVAGAARVSVLAELGLPVVCLDMGPLDDWEKGRIYVQSNAGHHLSDAHVVAALRYFSGLDARRLPEILEDLELEGRSKRARLLQTWASLPDVWDEPLAGGNIPLASADLLATVDPKDMEVLRQLFIPLSWSRGNAVNLLTWIREICIRDATTATAVLAEAKISDILGADLSPKDAMTRITSEIRRLRYPELTARETLFSNATRSLSAGTRWRLAQPDQFESDAVEMSVRVRDRGELQNAVRDLVRIAAHDEWEDVFSGEGA